jgi:hypothetical protein
MKGKGGLKNEKTCKTGSLVCGSGFRGSANGRLQCVEEA